MTPSDPPTEPADDTAAFQRFYTDKTATRPARPLLYRLLVGWWRKD
jgi:hypothetical protein